MGPTDDPRADGVAKIDADLPAGHDRDCVKNVAEMLGIGPQSSTVVNKMTGRLEQIWLKRAHRGPMDPVEAATLVEGKGVLDSANFGSHREVSLISLERWLEITSELGADIDPSARRAELLVSGVDLERSRGRLLTVGACLLRIGGEVPPCERMDEAYPGLRAAMTASWGGGAWAEVIRGGEICVRDPVAWHAELFEGIPSEP